MGIALYMDVHIPRAITLGLRMRDVDVLTAQEDGADIVTDRNLLDRATQLDRIIFTFHCRGRVFFLGVSESNLVSCMP